MTTPVYWSATWTCRCGQSVTTINGVTQSHECPESGDDDE